MRKFTAQEINIKPLLWMPPYVRPRDGFTGHCTPLIIYHFFKSQVVSRAWVEPQGDRRKANSSPGQHFSTGQP